jgi:uncharacterized protein
MTPEEIIKHFSMRKHPEGGVYAQTYRSAGIIQKAALGGFDGDRVYSTAIVYLLRQGEYSRLHRIRQDEVWHFYLGHPLRIVEITSDGTQKETILGQNFAEGQTLQYVVHAGNWFGATPCAASAYSFVGCTVAPGFDFADFELGERTSLLAKFPASSALIAEFTS